MRILTAILILLSSIAHGQSLWLPLRIGQGSAPTVTFNPSIKGNLAVLSANNLTLTASAGNSGAALTGAITGGKYCAEFTVNSFATGLSFGIINSSGTADLNSGNFIGVSVNGWGHLTSGTTPTKRHSGGTGNAGAYGVAVAAGDVVMIAFDYDNGRLFIGKNGVWMASSDPAAGTNSIWSGIAAGTYYICADVWAGGSITFNTSPIYTVPTGFTYKQ